MEVVIEEMQAALQPSYFALHEAWLASGALIQETRVFRHPQSVITPASQDAFWIVQYAMAAKVAKAMKYLYFIITIG
jgi:hypothetical protein